MSDKAEKLLDAYKAYLEKRQDVSLRKHQTEGVVFALNCYFRDYGCILADEMGLGKTCQAVAVLGSITMHKIGDSPLFLVVCPVSVLQHWKEEIGRFGEDLLSWQTYSGNKEERAELRGTISSLVKSKQLNVLLTSYELLLKDEVYFEKFTFSALVVDEAHRIKNSESQLHLALRRNNLDELFSLLSFVDRRQFSPTTRQSFLEEYNVVNGATKLRGLLETYMMRRTKEIVGDLPEKSEVLLFHNLTSLQKRLYTAILGKNYEYFEENVSFTKQSLMNVLVQLRKCCDHPYLFNGVEPQPFEEGEHIVEASGKLILFDKLLEFLYFGGHKVLVFSQMTSMLDILQDYLTYREYSYERLDGSVRAEERFASVRNFNEQSAKETFVFLLSTKAGGLGLNLVGADTVIFYDTDFNPQNDLQAAARAHRIGQHKPVKIMRLLARHSVEEVILMRAERKLQLTQMVIGTDDDADNRAVVQCLISLAEKLTSAEVSELISHGLEEITRSDEDDEERKSTTTIEKLASLIGQTTPDGKWLTVQQQKEDDSHSKRASSPSVAAKVSPLQSHPIPADRFSL